jgi:hypothetical protein
MRRRLVLAAGFGLACGGFGRRGDDVEVCGNGEDDDDNGLTDCDDALCMAECMNDDDTALIDDTGDGPSTDGIWRPRDDIQVVFEDDVVRVRVDDSRATTVYFGMAETGFGNTGWYGEDCLVNGCHAFEPPVTELDYASGPGDVELGVSTLLTDEADVTFLVYLAGGPNNGSCYIWGDDPGYYDGENCDEL